MRSSFLAALLALSLPGLTQDTIQGPRVVWGELRNAAQDGMFKEVVRAKDDLVHVLVVRDDETWIQVFDQDLRMLGERELPLKLEGKDHKWKGLSFQGDRIFFFSSQVDKRTKLNTLYVRVFGVVDLLPQGTMRKVHAIHMSSAGLEGWFTVSSRYTGSGFVVRVHEVVPDHRDHKLRLDGDLMLEADEEEEPQQHDEPPFFTQDEVFIDPGGARLAVGRVREEPPAEAKDKLKAQPVQDLVILHYEAGSYEPTVHPIGARDKSIQDVIIREESRTGDLLFAGLWGERGGWRAEGAFFIRVNRGSLQVTDTHFRRFDEGFMTAHMSSEEKKSFTEGERTETFDYQLRDLMSSDDGSMVLIGEQIHEYNVTRVIDGSIEPVAVSKDFYNYKDIVVVSIAASGEVDWIVGIPKRQSSKNDDGVHGSFALARTGEDLHFIFNDTVKNLHTSPGWAAADLSGKNAIIAVVTVNLDGTVTCRHVMDAGERATLCPGQCRQLEDGRMFVQGGEKNAYRYGMIAFK